MEVRKRVETAALVLVVAIGLTRSVAASPAPFLQVVPLVAEGLIAQLARAHAAAKPLPHSIIDLRRRPSPLVPLYLAFGALQVADARSSYQASRQGLVEVNPLMGSVVGSPQRLIAMKTATTACTILGMEVLRWRHPRTAVIAMAVITSTYSAIVANNYRQLR
jgi:hypothetical protein